MKVKQISIFIENKIGRLSDVTKVLSDSSINIRALSLADTKDFGILRLIVNQPDKAMETLKSNNYTVRETEVLAVEVPDKPGGLYEILNTFGEKNINVEYMYAFVEKKQDAAIMIFRFDDIDAAIKAISSTDINILSHDQVYNL